MEAVMLSSSLEKSISSCKHMKSPKSVARSFVSKPIENLAPTNNIHGGLLSAPPPFLSSYPPSGSLMNPFHQNHRQNHHLFRHQQPPLLPLPPSQPLCNSLPARSRSLSSSPTSRKTNRTRDHQSLTPKKSKSKPITSKGDEQKKDLKPVDATEEVKESVLRLGPDPNDLPKNVLKVLSSSSLKIIGSNAMMNDFETFSGSVFTLAPPPSSLPMPKFSLGPKLNCNAEAAEIDTGATDDLRRLLRIC